MKRQIIYLGHENEQRFQLLNQGQPQDLSNATKISATFGTDTVSSVNSVAGPIRWMDGSSRLLTFDGTDGATVPTDGSDAFRLNPGRPGSTFTYQTREGIKVVRFQEITLSPAYYTGIVCEGPNAVGALVTFDGVWDFTFLAYVYKAQIGFGLVAPYWGMEAWSRLVSPGGASGLVLGAAIYSPSYDGYDATITKAHAAGWWRLKLRADFTSRNLYLKTWADGEDEPGSWDTEIIGMADFWGPAPLALFMRVDDLAGFIDIAEVGVTGPDLTNTPFVTGEIRFHMEEETLTAGEYSTPVVVYDSQHPEGIIWGSVPTEVVEEFENPP